MVERRNISDMSFEEFFKKSDSEDAVGTAKSSAPVRSKLVHDDDLGFGGSAPTLSYVNGKFVLSVPRYRGYGPFNTAIDCESGVMPVPRLESRRFRDSRITNPVELDLTNLGVSPIDEFSLIIDGKQVFTHEAADLTLFDSEGKAVPRASGETVAVSRKGTSLKLVKASLRRSEVKGATVIAFYDVVSGGSISVGAEEPSADPEAKADAGPKPKTGKEPKPKTASKGKQTPDESEPKEAPKKGQTSKAAEDSPSKKRVKKPAVKVSLTLPTGSKDASVSVSGETIPLFSSPPSATVSVEGCEPSECSISVTDSSGSVVYGRLPVEGSPMELRTGQAVGLLTVGIEKGGKTLSSAQYFLIPDFSCEYSGKGDIPDDTSIRFRMFGEEYSKDIYDEDLDGPYYCGDSAYKMVWSVPVVTYDLGEGPRPYEQLNLDADELRSSMLVVKVRGAKKRKMYFGPEGGKKEDISRGWDADSISVNLPPLLDQVYASTSAYCFYLSVNSFPNRKFITVRNPESIKAAVEGGRIRIDAVGSRSTYVCRMYLQDKTYFDTPIPEGSSSIDIPADAVEAEVVENFDGKVRRTTPIKVRPLPFVTRIAGDLWLYVNKDKRIPIPEDKLYKGGAPDLDAVAAWHGKIVSMNPELKVVPLKDMKAAFTDHKG